MRSIVIVVVLSSVRAFAQPVLGPPPPPTAPAVAPPPQRAPTIAAPPAPAPAPVQEPASMFVGRPFRVSAHLVPFEQDGSTPPVRPFGMIAAAGELAPMPWVSVEAGIGFTSGVHLATFAHLRLPLARHAIGVAGGVSRGNFETKSGSYDCTQRPLSSPVCHKARNRYDGSAWVHVMGELEYRHPALRGLAFRLSIGIAKLVSGSSTLECSNSNQAECATVAPEVTTAPSVSINVGYAFGS